MANGRHSYVPFYASDWIAGVACLTRMHKSVFFDICCYIWDRAQPCPASRLPLMLGDLRNWQKYVEELIADGKLTRNDDGSLVNARALAEALKSQELHAKKSAGGRKGADRTNAGSADGSPDKSGDGIQPDSGGAEPEPEPDTPKRGKRASALPPDFEPVLTPVAEATVLAWPPGMMERELAQFKDRVIAKGELYKDWQAAFRTWIANADKWRKRDGRNSNDGHGPSVGAALDWINGT